MLIGQICAPCIVRRTVSPLRSGHVIGVFSRKIVVTGKYSQQQQIVN